jgi:aspartyl-tRNA(Asn)/glutamyl-tRNA(Gln) amidotransferase subunit A
MDHPGPIARTVADLAALLDVIAGPDPRDALCSDRPFPKIAGALTAQLDRPPRVGILRGLFWAMADETARHAFTQAIESFRARGAIVHDVKLPDSFADVLSSHMVIMSVEAAAEHEQRFRKHHNEYLPKIRGLIEEGFRNNGPTYVRAKQHQLLLAREFASCFNDSDVLATPAARGPAPDTSTTGDPALNSPWSFTGLPTVSWPSTISDGGLPLAVQLIGPAFHELELTQYAHWCEGLDPALPNRS